MKERGGFLVGLGQQVDLLGQPERLFPPAWSIENLGAANSKAAGHPPRLAALPSSPNSCRYGIVGLSKPAFTLRAGPTTEEYRALGAAV
jgi:hypothetical protein